MRMHRRPLEKLIYSDVFRCSKCTQRVKRQHPWLRLNLQFIFSRYTHCIRCGTPYVRRSAKRDRIDVPSKSALSLLQHLIGAPLNRCVACRIQYYDWRPLLEQPYTPNSPADRNTSA